MTDADVNIVDPANADEGQFKQWVKQFNKLDRELKDAAKTMGLMRKDKKHYNDAILMWMQSHDVPRVMLREGEFLERNVREKTASLNQEIIEGALTQHFHGNAQEAQLATGSIYDSRPVSQEEFLKVIAPKKRKVRPVDDPSLS